MPGLVSVFAACSLLAFAVPQASGQGVMGPTFGASRGLAEGTSKKPYTAVWTEKQVQTLANGTTVTHESMTKFARDASGRTYTEMHQMVPSGQDGQPREVVTYHIFDTAARTTTTWNLDTREATVTHRPEPTTIQARAAQTLDAPSAPTVQTEMPVRRQQAEAQREELGMKTIAGVSAKGTRVTRVIPAGREGNDQPITTTQEIWRSTEYGIVLMSVYEDPRYGTSTHETTEFTPGEPDAALFRVPDGYTVREVTPRTVANQ
jgi:hypothetical protein